MLPIVEHGMALLELERSNFLLLKVCMSVYSGL